MPRPWRIEGEYYTFRFRTQDLIRESIIESDKCRGCNWNATFWYVLAKTERSAKRLIKKGEASLCGNCYSDMLAGVDP